MTVAHGEQMREATRRDGNARERFFIGVMLATVRRVAAPLAERVRDSGVEET